jgi:uncharacterized protein (TIGR03437 family)
MQAVIPGLFTSSNYVLAVRWGDSAVLSSASTPARPGDILEIFGTGFGDTTTAVAPGLVFSGAYATTSLPKVTIGGTKADVAYCGLIGAGLYQINLTVPSGLAAGTYPVVATIDGVSSPTTAVMTISN